MMRKLYCRMLEKLSGIDFDAIFPGFHPFRFALYNDERIWLDNKDIPWEEGFYGNTTIYFENEHIAIWHVDFDVNNVDEDLFAANLVHEMFHAFQRDKELVSQYPNDLEILRYPDDEINYYAKKAENEMLAESFGASLERKSKLYQMIRASRELRSQRIGDLVHQEELVEQHEGMAEYAGCMALRQLDEDKFNKKIEGYAKILQEDNIQFFDIRRMGYYSGTLMRLLEREIGNTNSMEKWIQNYKKFKEDKLEAFFKEETVYTAADGFICGYDPMNQIRVKDQILASRFIMISVNGEKKKIQGPVVLDMKPQKANEVSGYYIHP